MFCMNCVRQLKCIELEIKQMKREKTHRILRTFHLLSILLYLLCKYSTFRWMENATEQNRSNNKERQEAKNETFWNDRAKWKELRLWRSAFRKGHSSAQIKWIVANLWYICNVCVYLYVLQWKASIDTTVDICIAKYTWMPNDGRRQNREQKQNKYDAEVFFICGW